MTPDQASKMLEKLTSEERLMFENLVKEKLVAEAERKALFGLALNICDVLGVLDENKKIRAGIVNGEDNVLKYVLGSLTGLMSDFATAQIPGVGRKAKERIEQRFAFLKEIVPIIQKYAGVNG